MSSNTSTPLLDPSSSSTLPKPSPAPLSSSETPDAPAENALDSVPPLATYILTDPQERIDALKLIADSVAQQRQAASFAVISNPLTIGLWVTLLAILWQNLYKAPGDIGLLVTTGAGLTMAMLAATRYLSHGYIAAAEAITWAFLKNPNGDDDLLIGTKFGEEIIGACVLRLESIEGRKKGRFARGGKGMVRAWTVKLRFRHKGVGTALLEEAVRLTRENLGKNTPLGFSVDHANSKTFLPPVFQGRFRKMEVLAVQKLEAVERDVSLNPKKR